MLTTATAQRLTKLHREPRLLSRHAPLLPALLAIAVAKVFFYDLATLDRGYRVLSFVVLGLFLLGAAYVYQRLRSRTNAAS